MKTLVLDSGPVAPPAPPGRTHGCIAVSADGEQWVLLNASPDLGRHLQEQRALRPSAHQPAPIKAVVLLDADIDHVVGLLGLRLGPRIDLYATPSVFEELTTTLPLVNVLQSYCGVRWHMLPVAGDQHSASFQVEGLPGLRFTATAMAGDVPAYSAHAGQPAVGDHIAVRVDDLRDGQTLLCTPQPEAIAAPHPPLASQEGAAVRDGMEVGR